MDINNKRHAFTLAEIMIVLLILTIIFAAFAPLITKRRVQGGISRYNVWNYLDTNSTMNAAYDPGDKEYSGQLFFGLTPDGKSAVNSTFKPLSKLVIRSGAVTGSNKVQRQIQFRYARANNADKGKYAGSWFLDGKNIFFGGDSTFTGVNPNNIQAKNNLGIGYGSLSSIKSGKNNTALGVKALNVLSTTNNNTAIGYYAGLNTVGENNTFAGSMAGANVSGGSQNTYIGYYAGYGGVSSSGSTNVFVGAHAGEKVTSGSYNVALGYNALNSITEGTYNTAIGAGALEKLTTGRYNVALGYKACSEVKTSSYKTCIGYNSGPKDGTTGERYLKARENDDVQRTYIGSKPYNYGGDAVLEIHNVDTINKKLMNNPKVNSNVTTVINGNLAVKGRTMFTVGNNLHAWQHDDVQGSSSEWSFGDYKGAYLCAKNQTTYSFINTTYCPSLKGNTSTSSDRRLKNIGSLNLAGLDELNKLKIYNYTFKSDKNKLPHVGVMAQELQKVFPNSVFEDENGYLKIRWDEMFFASINAIKQIDKKITAIVKRTVNLENQIAQLETENKNLKTQVEALSARVEKLKK